ncbi:IPT/TIG domain-containing protein [Christiangramia aestuarii]|uniref:IPT/TIG domain-containing protein n=1 Tax=Christiangramia aestuarii TaxID=1028746 RepID=UPI0031EBA9D9
MEIKVLEDGGVSFQGEYEGTDIETSGFYYSTTEDFQNENAIEVSAEPERIFTSIINTGLFYNQEYFVRAFIETSSGEKIESPEKSFVSLGSKAPKIRSINNSHLGDTVTIIGENFGASDFTGVKVHFDEARSKILRSNDTLVECIVPVDFQISNPPVRLRVYDKEVIYNDFKLLTPVISEASISNFSLGDTLKIYGDHFDTAVERTKIIIDNKPLEILSTSRNSLQFILPLDASKSKLEFSLWAQNQEVKVDYIGKLNKPLIESVGGNLRTYDTIVIKGDNFSPLKQANKVYFDEHRAEVLSASPKELIVLSPIGPYKDATFEVTYNLMDYEVYPNEKTIFQDAWLFKAETDYEFYGNTDQYFTKNGKLYIVQKNYGEHQLSFLEFDPEKLQFEKFQMPLPATHLADVSFQVAQEKDYGPVYLFFNSEKENFYELRLESRSYSSLKDYPAITSNGPEVFISDKKVFVTGGWVDYSSHTDTTADEIRELWAYDMSLDDWIQKADHPEAYLRSGDVVFQKGNDTYITYGLNTTGGVSFWRYSSSLDSWSNLNSHHSARFGKAFFMHNGFGYAYFSDPVNATPSNFAHRYDLEKNTWNSITPLNNRYYTYFTFPRNYTAFKVNGKIFIAIYSNSKLKFFEADTEKI